MDIFNYFISNHNENTPKFSEIFNSINELKLILNDKSYVLDHYLSMFFRLIKQMDFTYLQEKIHCLFKKSVEKVADSSENFHLSEGVTGLEFDVIPPVSPLAFTMALLLTFRLGVPEPDSPVPN